MNKNSIAGVLPVNNFKRAFKIMKVTFFLLFFTGDYANAFAGVALSGTVFCVLVIFAAWVWIVYRAIRGLIALNDNKPMYQ